MNRILLLLLLISPTITAQTEKYSRARIYADEREMAVLAKAGIALDHGQLKRGYWFVSDFSASDLALVKANGIRYDVLIDDVKQYYKDQNDPNSAVYHSQKTTRAASCNPGPGYTTPVSFVPGSMGGFYTYAEAIGAMDQLAANFPSIVKAKASLAYTTVEGRPIYWMKISDNPNTDEPEPEVFYNAMHHAREPEALSQLIFYMQYLCENYASDPEVQYLVNNTEMYFVPLVNPDGYVYNETTDPSGGGMWRKNRRNNGDGTYGVDLNRNYSYSWGYDDIGSSPMTSSDVYRGTAAFSEAETKCIRDFSNAHNFLLAYNYHTFGNLLLYPWGFDTFFTADSAQFSDYGEHLTTYDRYHYGSIQQVLYIDNGSIDDWQYGEQVTKPKTMGITPEVGPYDDTFWPPAANIEALCLENIWPNLQLAHLALKYAVVRDEEPKYVPAMNGFINYSIKRLGMAAPGTYTVSVTGLSGFASTGSPKSYSTMALLEEKSDSIAYTLGSVSVGDPISYVLSVSNGSYTWKDTISKFFGTPVVLLSSDGNSMTGWTSSTWGTDVSSYNSAPSSISDSPGTDYSPGTVGTIYNVSNLDLTDAFSAQMVFRTKYEFEIWFDYAEVMVSTDNGVTWSPVCGKLSQPGNSMQDYMNPVYAGYQGSWTSETVSLDAYIGQNIRVGFQVVADGGGSKDGFYFDDLRVEKLVVPTGIAGAGQAQVGLSQNMPNPANEYTFINYSLPGSKGVLRVYDTFGQIVMEEELDRAQGSYRLNTSSLAPGIYYYSLSDGSKQSGAFKLSVIR